MTNTLSALAHLSDEHLLTEVQRLAATERRATADLIAVLMELDARRLYLGEGCSSLFTYCTQVAVGLLAPHLTSDNHRDVLAAARHKSKRDVEHLVGILQPQPVVASAVRKLPAPRQTATPYAERPDDAIQKEGSASSASSFMTPAVRPPVVRPLAPERYKVQFTVSRETYEKLRRAQDLLRHVIPNGDPAAIFDRALTVRLTDLERRKLAATN